MQNSGCIADEMQTQNAGIHTSLVTVHHRKTMHYDINPNDKIRPSAHVDRSHVQARDGDSPTLWAEGTNILVVVSHYIIYAFITRTHSEVVLNQRRWQSLDGQCGKTRKSVDWLFEKVSFQMAFEGVESGWKCDIKS